LAGNCPEYAEQQWQQELADGIEGCAEDVQTMARLITAIQAQ
jgi:hypothetical protein